MKYKLLLPIIFICLLMSSGSAVVNDAFLWSSYDNSDISGVVALDDSGNSNIGTINGPTTGVTIKLNEGLDLNRAVPDYTNYSDNPFDMGTATSFTFGSWFNTTYSAGEQSVINKYYGSGYFMSVATNGSLFCRLRGSTDYKAYAGTGLQNGVPHLGACVINRTASTLTAYINGNFGSSTSIVNANSNGDNAYPLISGGDTGPSIGAFVPFDGGIDEVFFYKTAKTEAELDTLYNSGSGLNPYDAESITNYQPVDNDHDNQASTTFSANTSGISGSCELFLNSVSNGNATISSDFVSKSNTSLTDNSYNWWWQCGSTVSTSNSTYIHDTTNPIYRETFFQTDNTSTYNKKPGNTFLLNTSWNVTDTYLFAWNYTIKNSTGSILFNNATEGLTSSFEYVNHTLDVSNWYAGTYTQTVEVSDDHTANTIPDDWNITKGQNTVTFTTDTNVITIESSIGNLKGLTTNYSTDRYTFTFEKNNAVNEWGFDLTCDDTLYYRDNLYSYPVFVCGKNWVDFNTDANIESYGISSLPNGGYNINVKTTENSNQIEFNSIGGLNTIIEELTFELQDIPTITYSGYDMVNSSGQTVAGVYGTDYLEEIETLRLKYVLDGGTSPINNWRMSFTSNGTGACATGNVYNHICYSYDNASYQWVDFEDGVETSNFDGLQNHGDGDHIIDSIHVVNSTYWLLNMSIDEHFNPNVWKNYRAKYNFTDVKYQSGASERITKNQVVRINITSYVYESADQYKLDIRVNYSTTPPISPLHAHLCNSTYTSGDPETSAECILVGGKFPNELQDGGTKFRVIFTKEVISSIGDIGFLVLDTAESSSSRYYSLKTRKALNSSAGVMTYYSTNKGNTFVQATDGYESEANINSFTDGANPTQFITNFTLDNGYNGSLMNVNEWNITANQSYTPFIAILYPEPDQGLLLGDMPVQINFTSLDYNDEELNITIYENNTVLYTNLNQTNITVLWNATSEGSYLITAYAEKLGNQQYNTSDAHTVSVTSVSYPPNAVTIYGQCNNIVLNSTNRELVVNFSTTTDPNGDSFTHDIGVINGLGQTAYYNFSLPEATTLASMYVNKTTFSAIAYNYVVNTTDTGGLSNISTSSCSFTVCINSWARNTSYECQANSTQYQEYIDTASCGEYYDVPSDNGTWVSCVPTPTLNDDQQSALNIILLVVLVLILLLWVFTKHFTGGIASTMYSMFLGGYFYVVYSEVAVLIAFLTLGVFLALISYLTLRRN